MKKYLNIGLTSLFFISVSNIAYSGKLSIEKPTYRKATSEECFSVVTKGNVLVSKPSIWDLIDYELRIVYKNFLYKVIIYADGHTIQCTWKQKLTPL